MSGSDPAAPGEPSNATTPTKPLAPTRPATPLTVVEVGPRDGLQNEPGVITAATKIELIDRLGRTGLRAIEVTSFVRADRIPQLADGDEVASAVSLEAGVRRIALTPNLRGLERAIVAGVNEVAVFAAASETFSQRNINQSIADSLDTFRPVVNAAKQAGINVRGYVSTVVGCPYEGPIEPEAVARVASELAAMGCSEISLGDTIGVGTPTRVLRMLDRVAGVVPIGMLAVHMHDTYGMGLANSLAAIEAGVRTVDASVGGLGGCPYAGPGARGNLATEDLVYALADSAYETGVDLNALVGVAWWLADQLGRTPYSRVATALGRQTF